MPSPFYDTTTVPGVRILEGTSDGRDIDEGFEALAVDMRPTARLLLEGASQSVPDTSVTTATLTAVSGSASAQDPPTVSSNVVTVPRKGVYQVTGAVSWPTNGTGHRSMTVNAGSESFSDTRNAIAAGQTAQSAGGVLLLAASATISLIVAQTSGGALSLNAGSAGDPRLRVHMLYPIP